MYREHPSVREYVFLYTQRGVTRNNIQHVRGTPICTGICVFCTHNAASRETTFSMYGEHPSVREYVFFVHTTRRHAKQHSLRRDADLASVFHTHLLFTPGCMYLPTRTS